MPPPHPLTNFRSAPPAFVLVVSLDVPLVHFVVCATMCVLLVNLVSMCVCDTMYLVCYL